MQKKKKKKEEKKKEVNLLADGVKGIRYGWICWNQHKQLANS